MIRIPTFLIALSIPASALAQPPALGAESDGTLVVQRLITGEAGAVPVLTANPDGSVTLNRTIASTAPGPEMFDFLPNASRRDGRRAAEEALEEAFEEAQDFTREVRPD